MIVRETLTREDGVLLQHTYSDERKYIRKGGTEEVYEDAVDLYPSAYEYEETEEYIPEPQEEEDL
jgi:hypothetical protein